MLIDRQNFDFLLGWLGLGELLDRPSFKHADCQQVDAILDLVEQLTADVVAPHLRASDLNEPRLRADGAVAVLPEVADAVRQIADAGIFSIAFDEELGGLQLPYLLQATAMAMLMSGSIATASYMLLTVSNAGLLATFGSPSQVAAFALPQIAGQTLGTMCLSEPHAGSSLADIRTRALPDGADELGDRYRISGNKMWISAGDHDVTDNIAHLVLAKVPEGDGQLIAGTRGISLFVVPKFLPDGSRNDVAVAGLNHKMGYRGLPNCALNFGEATGGAIGWRVGAPGSGLPQMFRMMNEARISVGVGAAALASRGYLMSLEYARERAQGRLPGVRDGEQVSIIEHADVRRMLLAQKSYAEGAMALALYSARLIDEARSAETEAARHAAEMLLALLTPLTKSWPSEWAQDSLHLALQIFGGAGYTRDAEIELLYRDNRLNPIHEGTTGIQAQDLVARKICKDKGLALAQLHARVEATIAAASSRTAPLPFARELREVWKTTSATASKLIDGDARFVAAHATNFMFALGHAVVGWLWFDIALAAHDGLSANPPESRASFYRGKFRAWEYFAQYELPKVAAWLAPIQDASQAIFNIANNEF